MKKEYWDNYVPENDETVEVGFNKGALKTKVDNNQKPFYEILGRRPDDEPRPESKEYLVPTIVTDPEDSSLRLSLTDLSPAEIWDYFYQMSEVMTLNSFRSLVLGEYRKLMDATLLTLKGTKIKCRIDELPKESHKLRDYFKLLREIRFVLYILYRNRK